MSREKFGKTGRAVNHIWLVPKIENRFGPSFSRRVRDFAAPKLNAWMEDAGQLED
jgi:hypothetical protein